MRWFQQRCRKPVSPPPRVRTLLRYGRWRKLAGAFERSQRCHASLTARSPLSRLASVMKLLSMTAPGGWMAS